MLLQTNSYVVPKDKRSEHTRLLRKFRTTLTRLGADHFEVYEQVGANFAPGEQTGRFVQIMRFRDRQHQLEVQAAERQDPDAQKLIQEFCALINFPYQQQQGLFAVGFYTSALPVAPARSGPRTPAVQAMAGAEQQQQQGGGSAPPDPSVPPPPVEEPLVSESAAASAEGEGASLLDFAHLDPTASTEPPPMRIATEGEHLIESELAPADSSAATPSDAPAALEKADNGHHAGSFSDQPEAMLDLVGREGAADAEDVLNDADREAILGELTGEDLEEELEARKQKADGR